MMIKEIRGHRSIRKYKSDSIPEEVLERILEAGVRASNTGNMQVYSLIVTTDRNIKQELLSCHMNQAMVSQAPVVITVCADVRRFSQWCRQRGAEPAYDNFLWFINGVIDSALASQNMALQAEAEGLGICYLGTTTYFAGRISEILDIPEGVIPVTTLVLGYPDDMPPLTDRLPLKAVVHKEKYRDYSPVYIDSIWAERESSEETRKLMEANGLENLALIFTERRYRGDDNKFFSREYFETVRAKGFFNQ